MSSAGGAGSPRLTFHPLTPERWDDFERLFGPNGACAGCWCMWFRLTRKEFDAGKGEGNRRAMADLVAAGRVPGIMAYEGDEPVGWCSVAPREEFSRLERSRTLARLDDEPVWSVVCLFVPRSQRGRGIAASLLEAAAEHVRSRGGRVVEGYAVEPRKGRMADAFAFPGPAAAYLEAGFEEVARRSETRPIMRRRLD